MTKFHRLGSGDRHYQRLGQLDSQWIFEYRCEVGYGSHADGVNPYSEQIGDGQPKEILSTEGDSIAHVAFAVPREDRGQRRWKQHDA